MRVALLYHEDFKKHSPDPYDHPENPLRLELALRGLSRYGLLERLDLVEPPLGDVGIYTKVHNPSYLRHIVSTAEYGLDWIDGDTYVSPGTIYALRRLAGSVEAAVEAALRDGVAPFILGRPPGHHAGVKGRALAAPTAGFCIVNTAALIARLLSADGKVVMVDFDLHHGNGTQEIFYDDPSVVHIDSHQDPTTIYPGTGFPEDVGEARARGTKINIVMPPRSGDEVYSVVSELLVELARSSGPDYLVVSAGFDAYRSDNYFTDMRGGSRFYYEVGRGLASLGKPIVVVLEGGYGVGLEKALPAFVAGLAGWDNPVHDEIARTSAGGLERFKSGLSRLAEALKPYNPRASKIVEDALARI